MELTALCISLMRPVMLLLVAHVDFSYSQKADAAFRIVPSSLQLFEYSSLRFTCEGFDVSAGCAVRNHKGSLRDCSNDTVTSTVTCTISYVFASDSGEYWCEGGGERSSAVTITVTAGHVILESPVLPVTEGDAVTLRCRSRTSSTGLPAVFYKDGLFIGNSSTGNMTIESVSASDEGLYKCDISGAGESAESRLAVTVMNVLLLPVARVHLNNALESHALVVPTKLQLFEYSSISIDCEGLNATAGWTVMRALKGKVEECVSTWVTTPASVCAIKPVYLTDSGEYWCEAGRERSNAVNITVTAGDVILESPALPVLEGDAVTLRCRSRTTSSALIADFYKEDFPIGTGSTGEMTVHGVSKSDEGLYKCSISEFGESPQSWLAVRAVPRETRPPSDHCHLYLVLRTVLTMVMVALLLLLVGLLHFGKERVTPK